jgi:PAS domain S-box-containing protein
MVDRHKEDREVALLKSAVEDTNDAFVTIDEDHRVHLFNKAAERLFGYSREEVTGHDLNVIMSPDCSQDHRQAVERYIETRRAQRIGTHTEVAARRKNGESFPADISFSVSELDGRLYFTAILRDLTETKALQEQAARAERLAALGKVVAEITHEIKNPLMMIGGFAKQLQRSVADPKTQEKASIISEEVRRLESLLQELREYYLPKTLNLEEINVNELLHEVHALVKDDCKQHGITVELETDNRLPIIKGDKSKLKQVILNLVTNAIQAMDKEGTLQLQTRRIGEWAELTVADSGCGICADHRDKIFSTFFTTKKQGTGLGLSISKSIVEEHNGTLTFDSEEGRGTSFTIRRPTPRSAEVDSAATTTR